MPDVSTVTSECPQASSDTAECVCYDAVYVMVKRFDDADKKEVKLIKVSGIHAARSKLSVGTSMRPEESIPEELPTPETRHIIFLPQQMLAVSKPTEEPIKHTEIIREMPEAEEEIQEEGSESEDETEERKRLLREVVDRIEKLREEISRIHRRSRESSPRLKFIDAIDAIAEEVLDTHDIVKGVIEEITNRFETQLEIKLLGENVGDRVSEIDEISQKVEMDDRESVEIVQELIEQVFPGTVDDHVEEIIRQVEARIDFKETIAKEIVNMIGDALKTSLPSESLQAVASIMSELLDKVLTEADKIKLICQELKPCLTRVGLAFPENRELTYAYSVERDLGIECFLFPDCLYARVPKTKIMSLLEQVKRVHVPHFLHRDLYPRVPKPICVESQEKLRKLYVIFYCRHEIKFHQHYDPYITIGGIRSRLSDIFKIPTTEILLSTEGHLLSDEFPLIVWRGDNDTVHLQLRTTDKYKYPLDPNLVGSQLGMTYKMTVTVTSECGFTQDLKLECIKNCIRKPFIGGYRHKTTGTEYHHAFSQTPPSKTVSGLDLNTRDTQTAWFRNKIQCTNVSRSTQMFRQDHYMPSEHDKIITSKPYVEFTDGYSEDFLAKVRLIQRNYRAYRIRKWLKKCSLEYKGLVLLEERQRRHLQELEDKRRREEIMTTVYPHTRDDFEKLYQLVKFWQQREASKLIPLRHEAAKKVELGELLENEVKLLGSIEEQRKQLKQQKLARKQSEFLRKCADPVKWIGYKGLLISMHTLPVQRANELKQLYYSYIRDDLSQKDRMELIMLSKDALRYYNDSVVSEIVELLNRECDLLVRGVDESYLKDLRERIRILLLFAFRQLDINPEIEKYLPENQHLEGHSLYQCRRCGRLLSPSQYDINAGVKSFYICAACIWLEQMALSPINKAASKQFMTEVRDEERRRECLSSTAFLMQEQDFAFLVNTIWRGMSIISESKDIANLQIPRWIANEDWSPWNCILLTKEEAQSHKEIEDVSEVYTRQFIRKVETVLITSKTYFLPLFYNDRRFIGTNEWTTVQKPRYK